MIIYEMAKKHYQTAAESGIWAAFGAEDTMAELEGYLASLKKDQLRAYAKELGLRGYSGLRKEGLADLIAGLLLDPSVMRRRMGILTDEQIRIFEKALEGPCLPREDEETDLYRLEDLAYVIRDDSGRICVPDDVAAAYRELSGRSFHYYRRRVSWIMRCLYFSETFYGVVPADRLYEIYLTRPLLKMTRERFLSLLQQIPEDLRSCHIAGGYIISAEFHDVDKCRTLLQEQAGKEYYLPTCEEVEELWKKGYIEYRDGWQKLARWIREKYIPSREAVDDLVRDTWEKLASGEDYSRTYLWLAGEVLFLRGEKELLALAKLLRGANDHTRMRVHRGFTPMELRIRENNDAMFIATFVMPGCTEAALKLRMTRELLLSAGLRVDLEMTADKVRLLRNGNSLAGEEATEEKIVYPRDPCPCGSGRTYADCCGWKQARPDYKEA